MTHEEAKRGNACYQHSAAIIDGEKFPLVWANNEGCFLEARDGREFFAYWHEIEDWKR
jgi:hypothetical protein